MQCTSCGAYIDHNAQFCPTCGRPGPPGLGAGCTLVMSTILMFYMFGWSAIWIVLKVIIGLVLIVVVAMVIAVIVVKLFDFIGRLFF